MKKFKLVTEITKTLEAETIVEANLLSEVVTLFLDGKLCPEYKCLYKNERIVSIEEIKDEI